MADIVESSGVVHMEYPMGVKDDPHIKITARKYKFPHTDTSSAQIDRSSEILGRGYFYIPAGLVQSVSSNWEVEDIGAVGNAAEGEWLKAVTSVGISVANKFAPGGVAGAKKTLGALSGKLMAPNDVMVLGSVNRYSFVLSLQLSPQSALEGREVIKIINTFKKWAQPTLTSSLGDSKMWMEYPPMFDVFIRSKASSDAAASSDEIDPNNNLLFYRDMVIESFDVNFQGGTNETLFYRDGVPTLTTLRVAFKSLRAGLNQE